MTDGASDTSVNLASLPPKPVMYETNPTFDGLAEELVIEILEYALTYEKPLSEVLSRAFAPIGRGPLQLGLLRVNKSIHRLAIDIFYANNDFTVNFDNIEFGQPLLYFASHFPGILSNKPTAPIPVLNSAIFKPLNMVRLTIDNFGLIDRSFPTDDEADRVVKTFTSSLLAYLRASAQLKTLTISCVSAIDLLNLWKELQTYDATATAIGEIQIPRRGILITLQFPDLKEAWSNPRSWRTDTGSILDETVLSINRNGLSSFLLAPFFEVSPVDNVSRLRLHRRPGEPKRFLAFNLALLTYLMLYESNEKLFSRLNRLQGAHSPGNHWGWLEGNSRDEIDDYNEEPVAPNQIYKRSMKDSLGWYGDADWAGDEVWYNQICTEVDFKSGWNWGEVQDSGQHTGEKWLRSFWKTFDEFKAFTSYCEDIHLEDGPRQMDPLRGILRK